MYILTYEVKDYYDTYEESLNFRTQEKIIQWLSEEEAEGILKKDTYHKDKTVIDIRKIGEENLADKIKASPKLVKQLVEEGKAKTAREMAAAKKYMEDKKKKNKKIREKKEKARLKELAEKYPNVLK